MNKILTTFHIIVLDEYERNKKMIQCYEAEINKYPKGSIQKRKNHYYLCFRDDQQKVINKYIKLSDVENMKKLIQERKKNEEILKKLKVEKKELEYMLRYSKWR